MDKGIKISEAMDLPDSIGENELDNIYTPVAIPNGRSKGSYKVSLLKIIKKITISNMLFSVPDNSSTSRNMDDLKNGLQNSTIEQFFRVFLARFANLKNIIGASASNDGVALTATTNTDVNTETRDSTANSVQQKLQTVWNKLRSFANWIEEYLMVYGGTLWGLDDLTTNSWGMRLGDVRIPLTMVTSSSANVLVEFDLFGSFYNLQTCGSIKAYFSANVAGVKTAEQHVWAGNRAPRFYYTPYANDGTYRRYRIYLKRENSDANILFGGTGNNKARWHSFYSSGVADFRVDVAAQASAPSGAIAFDLFKYGNTVS